MVGQVFFDSGDQSRNTSKTSPAETLGAEFAKPAFNQIQPRAGRWSEVQVKTRMPLEPGFHARMFMRAIIIHDQMEIELGRSYAVDFLKESDELLMPMARHAVSDHPAVEHAQGGKQGRCAMADVIMSHCSGTTFLQGKTGLRSVKSLDLAFLVQAENQRLVWRIEIKADDIAQLLHEPLVTAQFEGPDQMGFQIVLPPDPPDSRFTQVLGLRHRPRTPMRRIRRLAVKSGFDHGVNSPLRDSGNATRPRSVFFQAGQAESQKTLSPQLHRGTRGPQLAGDVLIEHTGCRFQNDLGALDKPGRKASTTRPHFQNTLFLGRQDDFGGCSAHQAIAYTQKPYLSSYL